MKIEILDHYKLFNSLEKWQMFLAKLKKENNYLHVRGTPKKFPCYGFSDFSEYEMDGNYETQMWSFIYIQTK